MNNSIRKCSAAGSNRRIRYPAMITIAGEINQISYKGFTELNTGASMRSFICHKSPIRETSQTKASKIIINCFFLCCIIIKV